MTLFKGGLWMGKSTVIKEKMHIKYYVGYMDDGILIHESKEVLNRTRRQMEAPSS